jgi:hypothetical protein
MPEDNLSVQPPSSTFCDPSHSNLTEKLFPTAKMSMSHQSSHLRLTNIFRPPRELAQDNAGKASSLHDIRALADDLATTDSVDIQELYNTLYDLPHGDTFVDGYSRLPEAEVRLSSLAHTYRTLDKKRAIQRLHQRSKLILDDELVVDTDHPNYCFSCSKSFLDFILVVGSDIGIDMFIPNVPSDPLFSVQLNLRLQIKEFKAKYGVLGFDPTGAMICIGQTPSEDLWLAFPLDEFLQPEGPPFCMADSHGDTRLSARHYRIILVFLITILTKLPGRNFYMLQPERVNLSAQRSGIETQTNAL